MCIINKPKITVAIVTYNSELYIKECLDSVKVQTYQNKELVVIDGQSKDHTMDIVKRYADIPHFFLSEKDKGIYDAMNKALNHATGDYLIFLGSDDKFIQPDVLAKVAKSIINGKNIYYGNVIRTGIGDLYCGRFNKYKLAVKNICHQAIFYPKHIYKKNCYNINYRLFADYAYNIRLWKYSQWTYMPFTITLFNNEGLSSSRLDNNFETARRKMIIKELGWFPFIYSELYHFLRNLVK